MSDSSNLRVLGAAEDFAATVQQAMSRVDNWRVPGERAQLLRASSSVAANIAEAARLGTDANMVRQLRLALASAEECGVHLRLIHEARALDPISIKRCQIKLATVSKMLYGFIRAVEEREARAENDRRDKKRR
ncbi:MAG: four helix bundle protein [Gemmatimonadaceae bacterium]|nr:four helix bundle protein [Gemmatimonadaceae bacterium]